LEATVIGLIVFACASGGAWLGMWSRSVLPEHHLDSESKQTVQLGIGLIATMTALILGLVTASAKSSFDALDTAVKHSAAELLSLDRLLARYGPETVEIRKALKQSVGARIETIWSQGPVRPSALDPILSGGQVRTEGLADAIRALQPRDDVQRALQSRAANVAEQMLEERWLVFTGAQATIPAPFLVILIFWLTIIFASFGLFSPGHGTVKAVLLVCAMSVASAVALVLELGSPFDGWLTISPDPLRFAYAHLGE
jgi:hypothetical protein